MEFNKTRFDSINIGELDLEDQRYRISTGGPSEAMVASIKLAGVVSPPIVFPRKLEGPTFTVVSGFKRLIACRELGLKEAVVKIVPAKTTQSQLARIAIIDNMMHRDLNFVEQARMIRLLDPLHHDPAELCREANQLGIAVNVKMLEKLRSVNKMGVLLQDALIRGVIALPVALQIAEMDDGATADRVTTLLGRLGLGLNRQRELLEWLVGISRREAISIPSLLKEDEIEDILRDDDMDRGERGRRLRQCLKRRRYPELTEAENRFRRAVRAFKLEPGIQLHCPPHFEGQNYSLKIDFKHQQDLISKYRNLESVVTSTKMASLWDPIP